MANTQRLKLSLNLYINYLVFGMAIVILAQNMTVLSQQWHTTVAGVSYVISSIGIGRLLVLYISGVLSDKYGRKPFVLLGMGTYIPFFVGITFSPNMYVAYGCGILAGMANSFLDAGTYPALMELYPQKPATANIVIKAFASTGELILPIMVTVIEHYHGWFGLSFMACTLIFIINFLFISRKTFPKVPRVTPKTAASAIKPKAAFTLNQKVNAVALTIYGYISMATFYLVSQWLTKYGQVALNMATSHARYLVSIYSMGSILGVLTLTFLTGRLNIRSPYIILGSTLVSFGTLLVMTFVLTPTALTVGSFLIGFSAAGGVMQVGLTVMSELFPSRKGLVIGIYYTAGSIASFTIPIITGYLVKHSIHNVMLFDSFLGAIGLLIGMIIFMNTRKTDII